MQDNTTLLSTLFKEKLFRVPDYQRGYAWDRKNWQDLIDDIELLENSSQKHYTGTLVIDYIEELEDVLDEDANIYRTYDVVDGQQRLTTISILLNELANQLMTYDEGSKTLAIGIKKNYIYTRINGVTTPKLQLNSDINQFYIKNIISEQVGVHGPKNYSERKLLEAKGYFREYFDLKRSDLKSEYSQWLKTVFFQRIAQSLIFMVYVVPTATDVGIIFETMNNRGKNLTEMEKVKNYLLYLASKIKSYGGTALGNEINSVWKFIFESLMRANLSGWYEDNLLRSCWLMAYNYRPREWNDSNSVKTLLKLKDFNGRRDQLRDEIYAFLDVIKDGCQAYCDILRPGEHAFANIPDSKVKWEIIEESNKLVRMNVTASFIPLLMAVRIKYSGNPDLYLKVISICEKYAFRVYRLAEKRANAGQTSLYQMAYRLFKDDYSPDDIEHGIISLMFQYTSQTEFDSKLNTIGTNWYQWYGLKYLLYEYELSLNPKVPEGMSWAYLHDKKTAASTIEHILPQTPSATWLEKWDNAHMKECLNDIGNLVITFDNSVYSNKAFADKKGTAGHFHCYAGSKLSSEIELAIYDDWVYESLMMRRTKIISWIKTRWYVEPVKIEEALLPTLADDDVPEDCVNPLETDTEKENAKENAQVEDIAYVSQ